MLHAPISATTKKRYKTTACAEECARIFVGFSQKWPLMWCCVYKGGHVWTTTSSAPKKPGEDAPMRPRQRWTIVIIQALSIMRLMLACLNIILSYINANPVSVLVSTYSLVTRCIMFSTASFSFFSLHGSCSTQVHSTHFCHQVVFYSSAVTLRSNSFNLRSFAYW